MKQTKKCLWVTEDTLEVLKSLKLVKREPYYEVILRICKKEANKNVQRNVLE